MPPGVGSGEVLSHDPWQLARYVRVHLVVARAGFDGGVEVEAGAGAEVPVIILTRQPQTAGAGVGSHEHQAIFRR